MTPHLDETLFLKWLFVELFQKQHTKLHCVNDDFNANSSSMVLARPYLMMLYIIFPIHLCFPIRSRCVLKAIVQRKKTVDCFTVT